MSLADVLREERPMNGSTNGSPPRYAPVRQGGNGRAQVGLMDVGGLLG